MMGTATRAVRAWAANAYYKAPLLRRLLRPALRGYELWRALRVRVWRLEGSLADPPRRLAVLLAGSEINKNFWARQLFGSGATQRYVGKAWLWRLSGVARRRHGDCDLLITEVSRRLCQRLDRRCGFCLPCWIEGEIDVEEYLAALRKNHNIKADIRKIKESGLECEYTTEGSRFADFYREMYVPHVRRAHGDRAYVKRYETLVQEFNRDGMLLIRREGRDIGGVVLSRRGNTLHLGSFGVREEIDDALKNQVLGAVYYFGVLACRDKGYGRVGVGASRPFLKDGVLQFKRRRGMLVSGTMDAMGFLVTCLAPSDGVKQLLLRCPFVYLEGDHLSVAVFTASEAVPSASELRALYKQHRLPGCARCVLFCLGGGEDRVRSLVPPELAGELAVASGDEILGCLSAGTAIT